jgi:hypothetical protein
MCGWLRLATVGSYPATNRLTSCSDAFGAGPAGAPDFSTTPIDRAAMGGGLMLPSVVVVVQRARISLQ